MELKEGKIIGIDLGTTYSLAAYVEGSEPVIISTPEGGNKTPSVVAFLDNGEVIVGEIARRQAPTNPTRTINSIKRLMGRSFSDVMDSGEKFPFKLTQKEDQLYIDINGMGYKPEQISALILQKLKESAEGYLEEPVHQAIITVPAYFDDLQRNATIEAGRLAGLEILRLLNEPTAAAMAYGLGKNTEEIVAVYDFGGGTFDISILEIDHNTFEVLVSNGDTHLGGDDLDNAIVTLIVEEFQQKHGVNLSEDPVTLYRLKEVAEKAKCELSTTNHTLISLPFVAQKDKRPIHLERMITRREFESLIATYVERTIKCSRDALEAAGVSKKDLSKVILVGGSSRIPFVQEEVEDFFGVTPFKGVNPDEIVALGAATHAGIFAGDLQEVVLLDITPHSLGVEVKDGKVSKIIEKNSTIPIKAAKTFTTTEDNQAFVNIHVVQGESENAEDNRSLGKFNLSDIEPATAGTPRIRITFFINSDGVLEISANDMATGKEKKLTITHTFLTSEEKKKQKIRRRQRQVAAYPLKPGPVRAETATGDILSAVQLGTPTTPPESLYDIDKQPGNFRAVSDTQPEEVITEPAAVSPSPSLQKATASAKPLTVEPLFPKKDLQEIPATPLRAEDALTFPQPPTQVAPGGKVSAPPELPLPITREMLHQVQELAASEDRSESTISIYMRFCENVGDLINKNVPLPADLHLLLSRVHILCRFPEEARNAIKIYMEKTEQNPAEALEAYEYLVKHYPNYKLAIRERARLYQQLKKWKEAIISLENLQKQGEEEGIVNTLETLYEEYLQTEKSPGIQFKLVKIYLKKNKMDEAINILQELAKDKNYKLRALKILGLSYWQKNMYSLAWHTFKMLPLNPEITDILYRLANDMEKTADLNGAKDIYQLIMDNSPEYKDVSTKWKKIDYRIQLQQKEVEIARPAPVIQDARFEIMEEVNRGSMGVIYRARDKMVNDIVALKILNDYLCQDPKAVERFKSEARAAKKLSHPYIVRIHDLFESGSKLFLSMEFIEGTDLKRMITSKIKFTEETITQYFLQICDALAYAHSLGIIHRDIKPANIMITPFNTIKITDFGIAKILKADSVTKTGTAVIGTPLYMAPEQITGKDVDARTDIYSLGIMLYEIFNGSPPFCHGNIEYHHVHTKPPEMQGDVSEKFRQAIMKMIQKKPEDRFENISEILKIFKG